MSTTDRESPTDTPESRSGGDSASLRGHAGVDVIPESRIRHLLAAAISEHRISWHGGPRGIAESARRLAESDQMRDLLGRVRAEITTESEDA